jgi:predicted transcriptional regulator
LLLASLLICLWALWKTPSVLVRILTNTYVFAGSLTVSLLLLEIGLRVVNPWGMDFFHWLPYHMQGMVDHPELGYVHPKSVSYHLGPNMVTLNSQGLRDKEIPHDKPPGERRILLLGDSVTFGWGVSDGEPFADQMEPLLKSSTKRNWEVINAGVNGYNTEQEDTYFRIEGVRYKPDVVILTYLGNDLEAVIDPNVTTWRRYPAWPSSLPEALSRLTSLSYTYQAVHMFVRARQLAALRAGEVQSDAGEVLTRDPRWPASKGHLKHIAELCAQRGIRFIVAAFSIPDPAFFIELQESGIDAISLSEAFAQLSEDQRYVSRVDPHPTAVAHRSMAELLVRELSKRGFLN